MTNATDTGLRAWRTALTLLLLGCCALFTASCSTPSDKEVLHRGVGAEPESVDPHLARTTQANTVQRDLFEGLLGYTANGELVPAAAERWSVSDDGLVYTFHIREAARWSNGEPLTAQDFVFSFRRLADPDTAAFYGELLGAVVNSADIVAREKPPESLGVVAIDEHTLQITLTRPVPYFLSLLALPGAYPVNAANIAEHGDKFARAGNLVSNGAYQLEDWVLGAYLDLKKNPHYWDNASTSIERVRHHVTVDANSELYRYRAGELDITQSVPPEAYALLREERPGELRVAPVLGTYFYGFNLKKPELANNLPLRQALSMAIDRDVLTDKVVARGEQPAYSWVPPPVYNYDPPTFSYAGMRRDERHAAARRLYKDAGFDAENPLQIQLRYNSGQSHQRIALAIQSMWLDVLGFEAELVNEEFRVHVANVRAAEITELFRLTWNGDYNDAYAFLYMFQTGNSSNLMHYSNAEFDSLLERAATQTDLERRRLYLEEAEHVLLADHPLIPLYFHVSKHLVSPRVDGWQDNALDFHYSQHLSLRERETQQ